MENFEIPAYSVTRDDWSTERRGERDEARHNEKVKEAIKDNLDSIISDGDFITADPNTKKIMKVPMKSAELPRFRFGDPQDGVGVGDGSEQPGDVVGGEPGEGQGEGAGDQPGVEYYEVEMTMAEIEEMVFADLGLPRVKPKQMGNIPSEDVEFNDIRKKRTPSNLDMKRTIMRNMFRNAVETGKAEVKGISPDDYRVKTWEQEEKPENSAVVIAMADISGSMGDYEKYITRAFCRWTRAFLLSKYPRVDVVFIAHDTQAQEVTEEQFFSRGTGGGTFCSSANELALDIIQKRYPPSRYNVYPLHFSDGDNYGGDNQKCVDFVQQMLDMDINQYAYLQISHDKRFGFSHFGGDSELLKTYKDKINDDRFKGLIINSKNDVFPVLKKVFNPDEKAA